MTKTKITTEFARGARAAAELAAQYTTTHTHRLDDAILGKLNLLEGRPRMNKKRIDPVAEMTKGVALALAEMYALTGAGSAVVEVAGAAGLTIAECKSAGVDSYDWKRLKKAGVK